MIIQRDEMSKSSNIESRFLEQALDLKKFSASYRVLWFNAILEEVIKGHKEKENYF